MMAPAHAAAITPAIGNLPSDATTPPRMTAISPGKTKPTNADASSAGSAKTSNSAAHAGNVRIASESALTLHSPSSCSHLAEVTVSERCHQRASDSRMHFRARNAVDGIATRRNENCVGSGIEGVRVTVFRYEDRRHGTVPVAEEAKWRRRRRRE